ncbi:hypothetical protein BZK37_11010 [Enterococcus casseliflavus]|nr:hypothetical protein BZK37_11010 [Enterococcus casseliflavus]
MLHFRHVESIRPSFYRLLFSFIIARNQRNVLCFVFFLLLLRPFSICSYSVVTFLYYPLFSK